MCDNYYQLFVRNFDDSRHRHKQQRKEAALCKERNAVILSIFVNQGATTGEINKIELDDLDLIKAKIKIRGGLSSNERILPLKATQIGLIMNYLQNIRPQLLAYHTTENNKLFLALPESSKKETDSDGLVSAYVYLTKQVKTFNQQFLNFKQVRASVITFWIKTYGLRKAQYMAGHRYVSSTENYLQNNLDYLIEDINKLHPF
jgi:integrase